MRWRDVWTDRAQHCPNLLAWQHCVEDRNPANADILALLNSVNVNADAPDNVPYRDNVFRALELVSPTQVRYVILAQDPYPTGFPKAADYGHQTPHAIGVAFGVPRECPEADRPDSLRKVLQQVYGDRKNGDPTLETWSAERGVLLLNVALTVPRTVPNQAVRDVAGRHLSAWGDVTSAILTTVAMGNPRLTMICWGRKAQMTVEKVNQALLKRNLPRVDVEFSFHPTASKSADDPKSFSSFWSSRVGMALRV